MTDENSTLAEILESLEPPPRSAHQIMVEKMEVAGALVPADGTSVLVVKPDDPQELVASWFRDLAGRDLGASPTWIRLIRTDLARGVIFVIQEPQQPNDAELMVIADRGMISRQVIRQACIWVFRQLGLNRVIIRFRADRSDLAGFSEQAGFHYAGLAPRFFGDGGDAAVWAMSATGCRWLPKEPTAPVTVDVSPPSSLKVH